MFGPKLSAMAARDLKKLGVELHMGSIVTEADLHGIQVKTGGKNSAARKDWLPLGGHFPLGFGRRLGHLIIGAVSGDQLGADLDGLDRALRADL